MHQKFNYVFISICLKQIIISLFLLSNETLTTDDSHPFPINDHEWYHFFRHIDTGGRHSFFSHPNIRAYSLLFLVFTWRVSRWSNRLLWDENMKSLTCIMVLCTIVFKSGDSNSLFVPEPGYYSGVTDNIFVTAPDHGVSLLRQCDCLSCCVQFLRAKTTV